MFNEEERTIYETRMQSLADIESKIASAEEKGMEKGMEKAFRSIAINMLEIGTDIDTITQTTGLSRCAIEQIMIDKKKA